MSDEGGVQIRLATWNIGGGILGESHQLQGKPQLDHYADVIGRFQPDILCVQEAHEYDTDQVGQIEHLARAGGYEHTVSVPISPSHMEENASLTLGILSRFPISSHQYVKFPNPNLGAKGPHGDEWILFDKGYVRATPEIHGRTVGLVNAHCFPLQYFGASPTEERFTGMWEDMAADLVGMSGDMPSLAAVDLNHTSIQELLGSALGADGYSNSFEDTPTTPEGVQQDYLLYSQPFVLHQTRVVPTESDHSYCDVLVGLG